MTQRSYYYRPFSELFDSLLDDFSGGVTSISKMGIYDSKFPPCNIYVDEESLDLEFEFALAGFTLEEIDISFEDDYLVLNVIPEKRSEEDARKKETFHHGISRKKSYSRYFVPFAKYETEKTTAKFENGILKVHIPAKEERKPKKVRIQG